VRAPNAGAPRSTRSASLCGMARLGYADVAGMAAAALEGVTLLCATRGAAGEGPAPFAPLAALPRLRQALLGVGNRGPGWAAPAGGLSGSCGSGPRAVPAYLCPPAWSELSRLEVGSRVWGGPSLSLRGLRLWFVPLCRALARKLLPIKPSVCAPHCCAPTPPQALGHVVIEAHGWQSASLTARLPDAAAAVAAALEWKRCSLTQEGGAGFTCFFNHPDEGLFFPSWPDAVALGLWPCQGRLSAGDAAAAAELLSGYHPGQVDAAAPQPGLSCTCGPGRVHIQRWLAAAGLQVLRWRAPPNRMRPNPHATPCRRAVAPADAGAAPQQHAAPGADAGAVHPRVHPAAGAGVRPALAAAGTCARGRGPAGCLGGARRGRVPGLVRQLALPGAPHPSLPLLAPSPSTACPGRHRCAVGAAAARGAARGVLPHRDRGRRAGEFLAG
jgi:hypothetical protein